MNTGLKKLAVSAAISSVLATNGVLPVGTGIVSQGAGGTGGLPSIKMDQNAFGLG
jgi:hypothetical protein